MMQFCPNCGKWYDVSGNTCPVCRSQLLSPNEAKQIKSNTQIQQFSNSQQSQEPPKGIETKGRIGTILISLAIIIFIVFLILNKIPHPMIQIAGIFLCFALFALGMHFKQQYSAYQNKIHAVRIAQERENAKKAEEIRRKYAAQQQQSHTDTHKVECPYCHSHQVQKIGTLSRAGSIFFAGLASGKIGKQWHCHNCNSDF